MSPELIGVIILILIVGFIVFKLIKKIIVAIVTVIVLFLLALVGLGLMLMKDIDTYQKHPTKNLLLVLQSDDGSEIYSAASFSPGKQKSASAEGTSEGMEDSSVADSGENRDFQVFEGKALKQIEQTLTDKNYDSLLQQYFKVITFSPASVMHLITGPVSVFELSFTPDEVKQIIESKDPQTFLVKKAKFRFKSLLDLLKSDSEIKGGIFFGAMFSQIRSDNVAFVVGLIESLNDQSISVQEETIVFKVIKHAPIGLARTLIGKLQHAFSEGKLSLPEFGKSLKGSSEEESAQ